MPVRCGMCGNFIECERQTPQQQQKRLRSFDAGGSRNASIQCDFIRRSTYGRTDGLTAAKQSTWKKRILLFSPSPPGIKYKTTTRSKQSQSLCWQKTYLLAWASLLNVFPTCPIVFQRSPSFPSVSPLLWSSSFFPISTIKDLKNF